MDDSDHPWMMVARSRGLWTIQCFLPGQLSTVCCTGAAVVLVLLCTWAVVALGQLSYLGSCLTWADVYLESCLPGQFLPGQLLVHQSKHSNYEGSCQKIRKGSKIVKRNWQKQYFLMGQHFFLFLRGSLLC